MWYTKYLLLTTMFFSDKIKKDSAKYKNRASVESIVRFDKALEKRVGSTLKSVLGAGNNGVAFTTNNDRVFKLTMDTREAVASANILDKNLKNVVKIYDVFEIGEFVKPVYGIVQEKLDKLLPSEYLHVINELNDFWDDLLNSKSKLLVAPVDKVLEEFLKKHQITLGDEAKKDIMQQIVSGLLQLHKVGVDYKDVYANNVGLSGSTVKIFDLGLSDAPETTIPSLKERTLEASFKNWVVLKG